MDVVIPKGYYWTGIEQHNNQGTSSIKFYIHETKTKFIIVELEKGEEKSVGGPFACLIAEPLHFGLRDFLNYVRTGRP